MKRILLRVLFIVLAAFTGLMATVNPATLILTALSIFAAVKVDFFAGDKVTGRKPVYRWAWLWAVAIFVGTVAFSVAGGSNIDSTAATDLSRSVPAVTAEEEPAAEETDGFGQEPAEEPVPVEEPEPEPEPVQAEPEPEPAPTPEPEPAAEPEPAPEPVPVAEPEPEPAVASSTEVTFVGNMNSHKFHYPYCDSVNKMSEKNKLYWTGTRDELIAKGYEPCQNCNP